MFTDCPVWVAPKECWPIVWFVLYLKSVHWFLMVLCCEPEKKLLTYFLFWFLKSVYWLSSVTFAQRVLTDCLICIIIVESSLNHWQYCATKLKRVSTVFVLYGTWKVFADCPCCAVHEDVKLIKYCHQMSPPPKKGILCFFQVFPMFVSVWPRLGSISPHMLRST